MSSPHVHNHHSNHRYHRKDDDLEAPKNFKACQEEGDGHDTAKNEPAFFSDHDKDDDHDHDHDYEYDDYDVANNT